MKKLLSYSIILMTLCALVSCSNDDDNDGGSSGITSKKLLYCDSRNFIYNDKGKLEKTDDMTCIWTDNSVECDIKRDGKFTALLSGDKILRISCENGNFLSIEYSGDRRTKITTNSGHIQTYKWDGDNITEINYSGYENRKETYTYYPDKKGNGTIDLLLMTVNILPYPIYHGKSLIYAHPWLFGKGNKNLIKSITTQTTSGNYVKKEIVNYTYDFDTNGNPIKVYIHTDDIDQYARYTLLWEL